MLLFVDRIFSTWKIFFGGEIMNRRIKHLKASRGFLLTIFLITRYQQNRKFKFKIIATFDDYYKKNFSGSNETDLQPFVPSARSSKFPRLEPALCLHDQIFRLLLFRQGLLSSIESEHKDWQQGGGGLPVLVGLDQIRERTEEEFQEVLEEKLPNLPVAFIKVGLHSFFIRSLDLRSTKRWWRRKKKEGKRKKND